ncbi:tetrahydromethanopterin S-methyltransferase subunit A [Methanocella conradii]|uniref:tetrahydromethanopterin S-methyltransferase subunit A n=1 Tax=Methanocella conradii TaxID=1175444 RepID=UPI00157C45C0|nr:tetrahydromethanopterin S-methyltransferase subunit A [Methanocella conradii]
MMPTGDKIVYAYKLGDASSPVAVATLASDYEKFDLRGYAILGSCQTENFGVQLVIANMLKNPNIRYLILCGRESEHLVGHAFKMLHENGVAQSGPYRRIIGCRSPLPFIDEIPLWAVHEYQERISLIDMIGVEDVALIQATIDALIAEAKASPCHKEAIDIDMPPIDSMSWRKYFYVEESRRKKMLAGVGWK